MQKENIGILILHEEGDEAESLIFTSDQATF